MTSSLNVVDLFCGAGGMSLGFKKAGFNILYAVDSDQKAISTYKANLGDYAEVGDIYSLNVSDIKAKIGRGRDVDIVIGGPPCQGFSIQRRGSDKDERNNLVLEYARVVAGIKPKVFVMENVGGLLSSRGDEVLGKFKSILSKKGYSFYIKKIDASNFGVPQARKRVFFIGVNEKSVTKEYEFPSPIPKYLKTPVTVRDSIFDLKDVSDEGVPNHRSDKLSEINLQRIRSITEGQGRDSLPEHLQLACHKNNKSHRHLDTYGRMAWAGLAPTITARFDSFSRGRFGHPVNDRSITLREGARLQTFPDKFVFIGTKVEVARQIGNAVPPVLAKEIAKSIKKII
jgi:DNA (cytosine-5)-methyltransferase 1